MLRINRALTGTGTATFVGRQRDRKVRTARRNGSSRATRYLIHQSEIVTKKDANHTLLSVKLGSRDLDLWELAERRPLPRPVMPCLA